MPYETTIGFRHLKSRKKTSISVITGICMLGVVLGVTALVTVLSVTGGFQEVFRDKVLGLNGHVLIMKYGIDFTEYRDVLERARKTEGVRGASPFIFHEMMLSAGTELSGVLIKGVDPTSVGEVSQLPQFMEQGELQKLAPSGGPAPAGIVVGAELAEQLGLDLGDPVTIVSPLRGLDPETWAPRDLTPTSSTFSVVGIFRSGFYEYDNKLVYVHLKSLQDFFGQGDVVTGVELAVDDIFQSRNIASQVKVQLGDQRYEFQDWSERHAKLFAATDSGLHRVLRWAEDARDSLVNVLAAAWFIGLLLSTFFSFFLTTRWRIGIRLATGFLLVGTVAFMVASDWMFDALQEVDTEPRVAALPHILVERTDAPFLEWRNAVQEAEFLKTVEAAGPLALGRGTLGPPPGRTDAEPLKVAVKGFDPTSGAVSYAGYVVEGSTEGLSRPFLPDAPPPGALLGAGFARTLGYSVGDMLELTPTVTEDSAPEPAPVRLELIGLVETETSDDRQTILVDFPVARRMFSTVDAASAVVIRLKNPLRAPEVMRELQSRLGGHSYRTLDWKEINRNLFASLSLQKQVLSLIVFAMVLVAMFNIVSTLFIIVVDKSREISILKSMGATNAGVLRIFMIEGVTIGIVGTALGLALGVIACWVISQIDFPLDPKIYLISELPVRPVPAEFVATAVVAIATSALATVYPSLKAASLPPVEGLRYDR